MPDLFEIPESPSPKLVWLKKHRLSLNFIEHSQDWMCCNAGYTWQGRGKTEDEAILDYCERHGLKHWTLETL